MKRSPKLISLMLTVVMLAVLLVPATALAAPSATVNTSSITQNGATISGTVTLDGKTIQSATLTLNTINGQKGPYSVSVAGNGSYSIQVSDLSAGTTYLPVLAVVFNGESTPLITTGNSFTTLASQAGSVASGGVGSITSNSAVVSIIYSGVNKLKIDYGTSSGNYTGSTGAFSPASSKSLSGLNANTKYYFKIYGSTNNGDSWTVSSAEGSFTTAASVVNPSVSSTGVTSLTSSSATIGIQVTNGTNETINKLRINYGTSSGNYTATTGIFSANPSKTLSNLANNTTYYYKIEASTNNGAIWSYSSPEYSFTTLASSSAAGIALGTPTVTNTSAQLVANITQGSQQKITGVYFYYKLQSSSSWTQFDYSTVSSSATSATSSTLSGLNNNTTYDCKVVGVINNNNSNTVSATGTFTTGSTSGTNSTINIYNASDITLNSASLYASTVDGSANYVTGVTFYYKKASSYNYSQVSASGYDGSWYVSLSGLSANTSYDYYAVATVRDRNSNYISYVTSDTLSFTTTYGGGSGGYNSSVTIQAATNVNATGATLAAYTADGTQNTVMALTFYYKVVGASSYNMVSGDANSYGYWYKTLTGLAPNTSYTYYASATIRDRYTGAYNTIESDSATFVTYNGGGSYVPTVTTGDATALTSSGATLNGSYISGTYYPITSKGFEFKLVGASSYTAYQCTTSAFQLTLSNLSTGTYQFRAYVTTAIGTYYGEVKYFTISSANTGTSQLPSVTTGAASSVSKNGATLNAVAYNGTSVDIVKTGFVLRSANGSYGDVTWVGSSAGSYKANAISLTPGTTYYYKAVIMIPTASGSNTYTYLYGSEVSFKTTAVSGGSGGGTTIPTVPPTGVEANYVLAAVLVISGAALLLVALRKRSKA